MRIVFVYDNVYTMGGIQTWLTRTVPRLRAAGHEVALLTRPRGRSWDVGSETIDELSKHATIHVGPARWFQAPRAVEPPLVGADVLFACNLQALLVCAQLQQRLLPDAKVMAGVFHPREYCSKGPLLERRWGQHLSERLMRRLPLENQVFITKGTAWQMGQCLGRDLSSAPVLPIPVDTDRLQPPRQRRVQPGKVVSIARLTPEYGHHDQMIRVIRELRDQGHDFTYHAYGDGPARVALEDEVRRLGVGDAVFFPGSLPYERFGEALADAFAFIGTATSMVEAAACGVPTLVAIAANPGPLTHGFFQDTSDDEFGGYVPDHPRSRSPIAERLLWLAGCSELEYAEVGRASRARAEQFDLSSLMPRLVDILEGGARSTVSISGVDRALGRLDWLLEAVLLRLGGPDGWSRRYVRDLPT
jgi:1,2-diacylglycerol 3-alpha-glucosyltransferase